MKKSNAHAVWNGTLKEGDGKVKLPSTGYEAPYTFSSRFESGQGTNPEELIGAALAGCFSMALSLGVSEAGYKPGIIDTNAEVILVEADGGFVIDEIILHTNAQIEGISHDEFQKIAEDTKVNCPVSQALKSVNKINLQAALV